MKHSIIFLSLLILIALVFGCAKPVDKTDNIGVIPKEAIPIPEQTPDSLQEQASEVARSKYLKYRNRNPIHLLMRLFLKK